MALLAQIRSWLAGLFGSAAARCARTAARSVDPGGAARLRGAPAPRAPRDRARHVRDRLGRAAALLVARAARDPPRARPISTSTPTPICSSASSRPTCARASARSCRPRSRPKAAATTRTSTASRASTATTGWILLRGKTFFQDTPSGKRRHALDRTDRRHHGSQARRGGERAACLDGALLDDAIFSIDPDLHHQDLESAARSGSTATRPPRRSASRSR